MSYGEVSMYVSYAIVAIALIGYGASLIVRRNRIRRETGTE